MTSDKECAAYARDCVRLAGLVTDKEIRDELLKLASYWTEAAAHERLARAVDPLSQSKLKREKIKAVANSSRDHE
jgi:hypothetical protein